MRIQNGTGITPMMSDEQTLKIVNEAFLPYYSKGEYYKGTLEGLKVLLQQLQPK
jgi:uncharacterized membrane protein YgcG